MLFLKEINLADAEKEYRFFQEMAEENGYYNCFEPCDFTEFVRTAIPACRDHARGRNLRPGYVPETCFLLWDDAEIVGVFCVRHYLNAALANGSGHIGYSIHPARRGQGYATRGLALALAELRAMPDFVDSEIYLHCYEYNQASLRVMLKNGGRVHHLDRDGYHVRIPREA